MLFSKKIFQIYKINRLYFFYINISFAILLVNTGIIKGQNLW